MLLVHKLRRSWYCSRLADNPLRRFYQAPLPEGGTDISTIELVSLDLETTGLNPRNDNILSAGWVTLDARRVLLASAEHHLIRSKRAMNESSAVIHSITDDMAAQGEELCEVVAQLLQVMQGRVLLAHNAKIERGFLDRACRHCFGGPFFVPTIDTLQLALRRLQRRDRQPRHGELRLAALREQYHLPRYRAHNALSDALATAELFLAQLAHWSDGRRTRIKHLLS